MKSAYRTYRLQDSDFAESHWPRSVLLGALTLAVTFVFNAHRQLATLLIGQSAEYTALLAGVTGIASGLLLGWKSNTERPTTPRVLQRLFAGALFLQAALLYFINREYGILLLPENSFAVFLVPVALFFNALVGGFLIERSVNIDSGDAGVRIPLALGIGVGIGVSVWSVSAFVFSAPVLLFFAGGMTLSTTGLSEPDSASVSRQSTHSRSRIRLALLALTGTTALAIIAQVMMKREELHILSDFAAAQNSTTDNSFNRMAFWTYASESPPRNARLSEPPRNSIDFFRVLAKLTDDSLSILITNSRTADLEGAQNLNCATVSAVNPSPLQTFLNERFAEQSKFADENHSLVSYSAEPPDFLHKSYERWDVIALKDILPVDDRNPLKPALEETQEFFGACFTHLADNGFLVFRSHTKADELAFFRRISVLARALRNRGATHPAKHFAILSKTAVDTLDETITLVFKEPINDFWRDRIVATTHALNLNMSALPGAVVVPEIRACFQPNIATLLSEQFNADLTPLSLQRPFPKLTGPARLSVIQPVDAKPINDGLLSEVTALFDVLSTPVRRSMATFKSLFIYTTLTIALLLAISILLMRRAFNHTVHDRRQAQRRAFAVFALTLCGYILIALPALDYTALQNHIPSFTKGLITPILILVFSVGVWTSARQTSGRKKKTETGLSVVLLCALGLIVAPGLATGVFLVVVLLILATLILGMKSERFLSEVRFFNLPKRSFALVSILFLLTSTVVANGFLNPAFGYIVTMEFGFGVIVSGTLFQVLRLRTNR